MIAKLFVRDGQETYCPSEVKEIEALSDFELMRDYQRFYANVDSRLPVVGIIKNVEVTVERLARG